MKKILVLFLILFSANSYAGMFSDCLVQVAQTPEWKTGIEEIFNGRDLNALVVKNSSNNLYDLLSATIPVVCGQDFFTLLAKMPDNERASIISEYKGKRFKLNFSVDEMLSHLYIPTGILVTNQTNLRVTDVLEKSSLPKKEKFFSDECSDWTIADNLDDDTAVNIAGQRVFTDTLYGGSKNEFFLDFSVGDNSRAFPGLVLMDKTGSTSESIVFYPNIKTAIEKTRAFADQLKNSACSVNDLVVYAVALDVKKNPMGTSNDRDKAAGWTAGTGAAVGGAAIGITAWAAGTSGTVAAFGAMAGTAGSIATVGAAASVIPVVGWGVAVIAGVVALGIALAPADLVDIEQVMILDGPYYLR